MVAAATKRAVMAVLEADAGTSADERSFIESVLEQGRAAQISRAAAIRMLDTSPRTFVRKVFETGEWPLDVDFETENRSFCYLAQVMALKAEIRGQGSGDRDQVSGVRCQGIPTAAELGVEPRARPKWMRFDGEGEKALDIRP